MLSAISAFTRRGRRCVPPAPGKRPMSTSGSPSDALGEATLRWHASATWKRKCDDIKYTDVKIRTPRPSKEIKEDQSQPNESDCIRSTPRLRSPSIPILEHKTPPGRSSARPLYTAMCSEDSHLASQKHLQGRSHVATCSAAEVATHNIRVRSKWLACKPLAF